MYNGVQLRRCNGGMLEYAKSNSGCTRSMLLKIFDETVRQICHPIISRISSRWQSTSLRHLIDELALLADSNVKLAQIFNLGY